MRVGIVLVCALIVPFIAMGATLGTVGGDMLLPGYLQAYYFEKYFENTVYSNNADDLFLERADGFGLEMHSGMINRLGLRYGISSEITLGAEFQYIFQKAAELDFNEMHTLTLMSEYEPGGIIGIIAGFVIPFNTKVKPDVRFIDTKDDFELIGGVFKRGILGIVDYSLEAVGAHNLNRSGGVINRASAQAFLGFNVYEKEDEQKIVIGAEGSWKALVYDDFSSHALYVIPQTKIFFHNHFGFVAGAEILLHSENMYVNKDAKIQYTIRIDYVIAGRPKPISVTAGSIIPDAFGNTGVVKTEENPEEKKSGELEIKSVDDKINIK